MNTENKKKLEAAKRYLGNRWVLSKDYVSRPAHRVPYSYFMDEVRKAAQAKGKYV